MSCGLCRMMLRFKTRLMPHYSAPSVQLAAAEVLSELGRMHYRAGHSIQSGALRGHALGRACRLAASLAGRSVSSTW